VCHLVRDRVTGVARKRPNWPVFTGEFDGGSMRTVIIRVSGEDFSTAIATMRDWLEKNRCEPTGYRYDQDEHTIVVLVDFAVDVQAEAFAKRFGGQIRD